MIWSTYVSYIQQSNTKIFRRPIRYTAYSVLLYVIGENTPHFFLFFFSLLESDHWIGDRTSDGSDRILLPFTTLLGVPKRKREGGRTEAVAM